jgi:transketolase
MAARFLDHEASLAEAADALRLLILRTHQRRGGHLGASLSIVEILAVLAHRLGVGAYNEAPAGNHLILSKGHAALAFYCQLALEGRVSPDQLRQFATDGADLEPHPNERRLRCVGASSGSLGQGLSIGCGLALAARLAGSDTLTTVIIGDGEANEGQIWEAAMSAPRLGLGRLLVVQDRNGMQQDGAMADILPCPDLAAIWEAFGWSTSVCDGHDTEALGAAVEALLTVCDDRPKLLVAHTVKGAGIAHLEGRTESHFPEPVSAEDIALMSYSRRSGQKERSA